MLKKVCSNWNRFEAQLNITVYLNYGHAILNSIYSNPSKLNLFNSIYFQKTVLIFQFGIQSDTVRLRTSPICYGLLYGLERPTNPRLDHMIIPSICREPMVLLQNLKLTQLDQFYFHSCSPFWFSMVQSAVKPCLNIDRHRVTANFNN